LISKPFYESLPTDYQEIVGNAAIEAVQYERELNREANEEYVEALIEAGVDYTEVSKEARNEMQEVVQPFIGQDVVDEMYEAIEEAQ
jgi:TRAP-type C4-dicarboxylate transport system substrate-binding protein